MTAEEIIRDYRPMIEVAIKRYRSHPDWEDLLAETVLDVWVRLSKIDPATIEHPGGLVAAMATCAAAEWMRDKRNRLRPITRSGAALPKAQTLGDYEIRRGDFVPRLLGHLWVMEMLSHLPEVEREAIAAWLKGESMATLAKSKGEPETTWKDRRQRALKRLRRFEDAHNRENTCCT